MSNKRVKPRVKLGEGLDGLAGAPIDERDAASAIRARQIPPIAAEGKLTPALVGPADNSPFRPSGSHVPDGVFLLLGRGAVRVAAPAEGDHDLARGREGPGVAGPENSGLQARG